MKPLVTSLILITLYCSSAAAVSTAGLYRPKSQGEPGPTGAALLRKNLATGQYHILCPKIRKLHNTFLNGQKGAYASILHEPGKGLTYKFNGQPVLTIECDEFVNTYFSIWLGERPSSRTMKEAMLNKG